MMTFGERVKQEREKQRLSHREVARRAGISAATLGYIESGQTQDPRLSLVIAIAEALGIRWRIAGVDDVPRPRRKRAPQPGAADAEEAA